MIAIAAIIVAIARPRTSETFETVDTEGVDIVLTMDISTSMLAEISNRTVSVPPRILHRVCGLKTN